LNCGNSTVNQATLERSDLWLIAIETGLPPTPFRTTPFRVLPQTGPARDGAMRIALLPNKLRASFLKMGVARQTFQGLVEP